MINTNEDHIVTATTKALEEKFNGKFPTISQANLGDAKPNKFNKARFLKAAQELQKAVKDSSARDSDKR